MFKNGKVVANYNTLAASYGCRRVSEFGYAMFS